MSDPLNQVEVSPETLQFTESRDTTQRFIKISNFSNVKIAYRIRVSVQHIFVVPHNEGFVNGNEEVDIVVTMKPLSLFPDADLSRIKFAVEIAPVEPGKDGNIKEFLATNSNSLVRRSVLCYVTRVDLAAQEAEARRQEEQVLADTEEQAHYVQQSRPFQSQQQDIEPIQQIPAIPIQQGLLSEQDLGGNDNEYAEEEEEFPQHQYQHYQPQQRQHRSEDHGMAGEEQHFDGRSNSSPNTELQKISSDTASRNENVAFSISALSDQMDSAPTEEENAHNGGGGGSGGNRFPMSLPDDRGDQHFEPQGDARPSRPRPSASGSAVGMNSHQGSLQGMSQGPTPVAAANQANVVNHQVSGPRGRVLELMVKNVSRDAPLTKSEVAELQEIRGVLSKDDWQEWLVVARKEKYRRQDEAAATLLAEREKEEAAEREREREKERERAKRAADVSMVGDNSFYDSMHNTSIHAHQGYQPGGYQGQGQGQNHHYPLGQGGFTPQPQSQFESVRGQYNSRLSAPSYQAPVSVNSSSAPDTSPRPAPPLSQLTMDQIPSTPTSRSRANSRAGTPTHRDSRAGEVAYSTAASSSTTFNIPREFQRDFQKQMEPNEARSAASASPFRQRPTGFTAGSSYNNSAHTHYTSTSSNGVNSNANGSFLSQRSASPQMLSPQKSVPHGIQAPGAGFPKSHPFGTVSNFVVDNRLHQQSSGPSNVTQRVHGSPTKPDQMHMHMHMQSQSVVVAPGSPTKYSQPQREELSRANTMTRAAVPTQFGRPQPQPQFYQPQADTLSMSAGLSRARYGAPPPPPPEEFEPEPYYPRGSSVVSGTVSATGGAPVLPMSAPAMPLQPPTASVSRRRGPLGSSNNGFMPQQQNQSPNLQQHSATAPVSWDNGKDNWTQSTQYQVHRAPQSPSAYGATMIEREPDYLSNCDPAPRFSSTANAPSSRTQPSSSTSLVPDLQPQSTPAYLNMMATGVQTVTVNPVDGIVTPCYTDMNYNTSNKAFNQSYNQSRGPPSSDMYFANDGNEDPADLDMQRAALNATAMSQRLRSSGGVQQMQSQQNYRQHSQGQNQPVYVQPYQQYVGPQMTSDIHTAYAALPVDDTRFDNSNTSYIKHVVPMQNQNQMHSRASPAPSPVRSRPMSASSNSYVDSDRGNGMSVSSQSQQQSRFSQSQNLRGGNVSGAATVPKFLSANAAGSSHNNVGRIVTPVLRSTTPNRHNNQSVNRGIVSRNNMSNSSNLPFTFEGVKYDKAQDRLARVCLAQGPLVKVRQSHY